MFLRASRYKLTSEPIYQTLCHCSDCRRAAGAPAVAWITVPRKDFSFSKGKPKYFQSSPNVQRTFCPTCGTSLTYTIENRKGEIDITTGSLDHPENFPPKVDFFCRDNLPWMKTVTDNLKE